MNKLNAIRYFEFHVFKGVTEDAETTFERDNFSSYNKRLSGRDLKVPSLNNDEALEKRDVLGYYMDDFQNNTQKYVYADGHEDTAKL